MRTARLILLPAQFGVQPRRVDNEEQQAALPGVQKVGDSDDLFRRRQVKKSLRLQTRGRINPRLLSLGPGSGGGDVGDGARSQLSYSR